MANKPASKTTKRGPTKASALKALDLTQEDLELLQLMKSIPEDINTVEEAQTPETQPTSGLSTRTEQTFYVRNLRNVPLGFRLTRQEDKKKRTDLKPRGQRGDLVTLNPEDLTDQALLDQVAANLVEIITAGEAKGVVDKQVTNSKTAIHPAMEMLRNELGQKYEADSIRVEAEYNNQGETVATVEGVGEGASRGQINRGGIQRSTENTGGNPHIVSDGFSEAPKGQETEYSRDQRARQNNIEGPAAGLGNVTVTVDPVQKT